MLCDFFVFEVRKQSGEKYPANSVYSLYTAINTGLKSTSKYNLFDDEEFAEARWCLDAAMRKLSLEGLGSSCRKRTKTISLKEENVLWTNGWLGEESPNQLQDTLLYLTGLHFALRGGKEHRDLRLFKCPQITGPHEDEKGRKYLLYKEDVSKTNQGGIKDRKITPKEVRAYENVKEPSRCFVRLIQKYRSLCPRDSKADYFYFAPMAIPQRGKWYKNQPVGHNTLQSTIKRLCEKAGIKGKKTNHSLRATAATRLFQADMEEQLVCEVTGHRSEAVRTYVQEDLFRPTGMHI